MRLHRIYITLLLLVFASCAKTPYDHQLSSQTPAEPQLVFTSSYNLEAGGPASIGSDASHGTCTVTPDGSVFTYTRPDDSYTGVDSCTVVEPGCGLTYSIDFSVPDPQLTTSNGFCI